MKRQFKLKPIPTLGILCWIVAMTSILLQNLYLHALLDAISLTLLCVVSFFVGFMIKEVRVIVVGWLITLTASITLTFFVLSLPLILGLVPSVALSQQFYAGVIVMIFRAIFPTVLVLCLFAGVIGAIFGEKTNF